MGLGHDQLLLINSINSNDGRIMVADFSSGKPPAQIKYWENWGESHILDGWIDKYVYLSARFVGIGHSQLFLLH